jgi:hypothetical protein
MRVAAILLGLAFGVVLALWHSPSSSWLIRLQAALAIPTRLAQATPPELSPYAEGGARTPESEAAFRQAAEAMQGDAMAQVSAVVRDLPEPGPEPPPRDTLSGLLPMTTRFPRNPAVIAATLRYAAGANIRIHRTELDALGTADGLRTSRTVEGPLEGHYATFDRLAAEGERLDPRNAFFPAIRSAGLYAAGHDDDALRSMIHAAALPQWNDYVADEVSGAWRLANRALGPGNTLVHAGTLGGMTFTHYAQLKDTAALIRAEAARREKARNGTGAADLRLDLLKVGALMRAQSTTLVGTTTGTDIQELAVAGPHGSGASSRSIPVAVRRDSFLRFLVANGHAADVPWVRGQFAARDAMWKTLSAGYDRFDFTKGITTFGQWVIAGLVFLDAALWVLLFGALCVILNRTVLAGELPKSLRISRNTYGAAAAVGCAALFWFISAELTTVPRILAPAVGLALTGMCVWLIATTGLKGLLKAVVAAVVVLPVAAVLAALVLWLGRGFAAVDALLSGNVANAYSAPATAPGLAMLGLVIAVLTAFALAIVACLRGEPIVVTVIRRYGSWSIPIACALMLVYGGIAVNTARMSAALNQSLKQIVRHEGRFYADLAGKQWPQ